MIVGYQTLLGVLPVKCNKTRNRERYDTLCVMCKRKKETIKHLLCSCKNDEIVKLMMARHDKVENKLALWGEIAKRKGKITSVYISPRLDTEALRIPDLLFTYKRNNQVHQTFIEVTIAMDNATKCTRKRKQDIYRQAIEDHANANTNAIVKYKVLAFGVLGAISKGFESIMTNITSKARTDWLVTQVCRAVLVHNGMIWTVSDKKYNESQLLELGVDEMEEEFDQSIERKQLLLLELYLGIA